MTSKPTVYPLIKRFSKGLIAIFSLKIPLFLVFLLIQSCSSDILDSEFKESNKSFIESIQTTKSALSSIQLKRTNRGRYSSAPSEQLNDDDLYLILPEGTENPDGLDDFNDIVNSVNDFNAIVSYQESATGILFNIPTNEVVSALDPSLIEARSYLIMKGFTDFEIDQMVLDEGGQDHDLIPLVMLMVQIENQGEIQEQASFTFFNSAFAGELTWEDYVRCAIVGIGADVLYALGGSNGKTWAKAAMKKAFKSVAKRLLGPIGVAISVASFGVCIAQAYFE